MKDYDTRKDRKFREMLERRSIDEGRANVATALNKIAAGDALGKPGLSSYLLLQAAQRAQPRHVAELNKAHDKAMAEGRFDRLHPKSELARRLVPASPTGDIPVGERDDARDQPYTPNLRDFVPVRDAGGSMDADAKTRASHFAGQGVEDLTLADLKERLILSLEQMRALSFAKLASSRYW